MRAIGGRGQVETLLAKEMNHDSYFEETMVYRTTPKTRALKQAQRERVLNAARELVAARGFAAASIQAVAQHAGVATGSVYRHFPSKAHLFVEVFTLASAKEVQTMAAATRVQANATQRLVAGVRTWATRALQGRTLAYALIAEPVMPQVEAARLQMRRAYVEVLRDVLQDGHDQGEFQIVDIEVTAAGIVGALAEALVGPLSPEDTLTAPARSRLIDALVHFCVQAVTRTPTQPPP